MRSLLLLLAIPSLVLAEVRPRSTPPVVLPPTINQGAGFGGALKAPVSLQPPVGYPLTGQLGNYVYPVNPLYFSQCPPTMSCPGIPAYLAAFNRGIPGVNGPGQAPTGFNILKYGPPTGQPQTQMPQAQGQGGQNPFANFLQALGGGRGRAPGGTAPSSGFAPGSYDPPSYIGNQPGNFRGTPVNSGPDGLCYKPGLFQTTAKNELGGRTPCQVIEDTITKGCTGDRYFNQIAQGHIRGMDEFCPGWSQLKGDTDKRAKMLTALVAAIVKTESSWRTDTRGDGGKSRGLLQLTASTDSGKGCACGNLRNEFDIKQNLECGTHMIIKYLAEDRVVGSGTTDHDARGIARSFGPFRDGRGERADIIRRVSGYCRSLKQNAPPPAAAPPATS